jgi:hypothetical protein
MQSMGSICPGADITEQAIGKVEQIAEKAVDKVEQAVKKVCEWSCNSVRTGTGMGSGRSRPGFRPKERMMIGTETIILILVLVLLFGGGGGYYWSRRGR